MTSIKRHFSNFSLQRHNAKHCVPIGSLNQSNIDLKPSPIIPADVSKEAEFNETLFINDVRQCLQLCSDYIQSLNLLCNNGTNLARCLMQVFGQDASPMCSGDPQSNDNFLHHYGITERFLNAWDAISVATAGASATVKTETLMSLQEVINRLEGSLNDRSPSDDSAQFNECMKAAKNCLLSYIELQAQFSYTSWLSLTSLSQALNCDQSLVSNINGIKRHFEIDNSNCSLTPPTPQPLKPSSTSAFSTGNTNSNQNPFALDPSSPIGVSRYSLDSSNGTSDESDSYGLEDAINLLSLRPVSKQRKKPKNKPVNYEYQLMTSPTCDYAANDVGLDFLKPSTWPGRRMNEDVYRNFQMWPQTAMSEMTNNQYVDSFQPWNSLLQLDEGSNRSNDSDESVADTEANVYAYVDSLMQLQQEQKQSASKRLSCSSDGINQDQGLFYSGIGFDLLGSNTVPLDVRTAKTSTWPLKQVTSGNMSPLSRADYNNDLLLSSPITPQSLSDENCVIWPFIGSKPS